MTRDPEHGWDMLLRECQRRRSMAEQELSRATLNLECVAACVAIYHRRGEQHPSDYGASSTVADLTKIVERLRHDVQRWTECEALVRAAMSDAEPVVVREARR